MAQKIFRSDYVIDLLKKVKKGNISLYEGDKFPVNEDMLLPKTDVEEPKKINIVLPDNENGDKKDFENSIAIYKAFPNLDRTQATDIRFWTYLAHTIYWDYLKVRWPLTGNKEKDKKNVLQHWFIDGLSAKNLARHGVSSLWWVAHTTITDEEKDPFKLTREFYTLAEYKWEFTEGSLGRYPSVTRAFLEYVSENNDLFEGNKQTKVRELKKKLNFISGYTNLGILSKKELKKRLADLQ